MRDGFYDDPDAVEDYLRHRHAEVASPNLVMEDPAVRSVIGSVEGLDIVDLGCGDGSFLAACVAEGANRCLGVDGSDLMLDAARRRLGDSPAVTLIGQPLERLDLDASSCDLVVARLSLHYVADLEPVFDIVCRALRPGGRLVMTVVHPVITAPESIDEVQRTSVTVDDYFAAGPRRRTWFGRPVVWQHRTIEQYVTLLTAAGLQLQHLRECAPVEALFDGDDAEFERRRRVPLFLLLSATA